MDVPVSLLLLIMHTFQGQKTIHFEAILNKVAFLGLPHGQTLLGVPACTLDESATIGVNRPCLLDEMC